MAALPPDPNPDGDPGAGPDPGPPRWVKGFGLVALALVVLFLVAHLAGGGFAGHEPPAGPSEHGTHRP
ncbi:MAG TPA: hypothetical protein VFS43_21055 [Polyangiaceae bacterium]|nr:hypothetical protein [Polyangiaceae bacterium]